MKYRTIFIVAAVVFGVLCLIALGVGAYTLFQIPKVETQIMEGSTPVHVQLYAQDAPAGWPMNSAIPVAAKAMGGGTITSIELYINGQLYEKVSAPAGWGQTEFTTTWKWQPGTTGAFLLVAKAANTEGGTGVSDPVIIHVRDAVAMVTPYLTKEGQTLVEIAASEGIDPSALAEANPEISDPAMVLPVETFINLPKPPAPVSNPKIIQGFTGFDAALLPPDDSQIPLPEEAGGNPPPPEEEGQEKGGIKLPSIQDIQFWLEEKTSDTPDSLPLEPVIYPKFSGCEVTLNINSPVFNDSSDPTVDKTKNENGFFIYRSQDGGAFKRIATLPPISNFLTWEYQYGYKLPKQFGLVTYTVSAFNAAGETMSAPVTLDLIANDCKGSQRGLGASGGVRLENGDLILPYKMDLAYLYLSINGSRAFRVPQDHRMFQPKSGVKLNIYDYLAEQMPSFSAADFDLSMEVWGWIGSELKFVGNYQGAVHRSVLLVCSQEGEGMCRNGIGEWVTGINFSDQKPVNEQVYEFKWISTGLSEADEVCIEVAAGPFPNDDYWNMGFKPISAGCYYWDGEEYVQGSEGYFTEYMQYLLFSPIPAEDLSWGAGSEAHDFGSNWFYEQVDPDSAYTIYFRVLPRLETSGYTKFTNTVALRHDTPPLPSELPPLASPYDSIYSVKILRETYVPPTFEAGGKWGCVIVEEDPTGTFAPGTEICPPPYGTMSKSDCDGNWDAWCLLKGAAKTFTDAYDQMLWVYDLWKTEIAKVIAETIPWCGGNEKCIGAIKWTMEKVIKYYTGIPENPPKSDEVISKDLAKMIMKSAIEAEKSETGLDYSVIEEGCAIAKCEEKLAEAIQQELKKERSVAAQPACIDPYNAYFKGKDAVCLDPSIIVHTAPGGGNRPGMISIQITRKVTIESVGVKQTDEGKYRIHLNVDGENGSNTGQLYPAQQLEIPWLQPGETIVISTQLYNIGGEINEPLYFNGISHMKAVETCYSPDSSWDWVPCLEGGADSWDFRNPPDKMSDQIGQP